MITLQTVLWTTVPAFLFRVLPLDSLEALAWGSGFSLGNAKHPPLSGWMAGLVSTITGHADWPIYLLSQLCVIGGMIFIYLLAREFLDETRSVLAGLTPQFIFYYNITTPEFNVNLPQLFLWPAAALFFVRAYRFGRLKDWIFLGIAAGFCLLSKYYSVLLGLAFFLWMTAARERRKQFTGLGPWAAAACCVLVILPHGMWAAAGGLTKMAEYTQGRMTIAEGTPWYESHLLDPLLLFGNAVLAALIPAVMFLLAKRERPAAPAMGPARDGMRFAAVMMLVPLGILLFLGISGQAMRAMWLVPIYFPLGILLAAFFPKDWTEKQLYRFRLLSIFFFTLTLIGFTIAGLVHTTQRRNFPAKEFTAARESAYRAETGRPLRVMIGDAWCSGMFRHYAPSHPMGCIWDNACEVERLRGMLEAHGGLAVSDDPNDIAFAIRHFGTAETKMEQEEIEFHSYLGRSRTETIYRAILPPKR